jgi:hypothetical protein
MQLHCVRYFCNVESWASVSRACRVEFLEPVRLLTHCTWTNTNLKTSFFRDTTPCSPLKVNWTFDVIFHLHLQCEVTIQVRNQHELGNKHSTAYCLLDAGIVIDVFFNPEEVNIFLRNIAWHTSLSKLVSQKIKLSVTTVVSTSHFTRTYIRKRIQRNLVLALFSVHLTTRSRS